MKKISIIIFTVIFPIIFSACQTGRELEQLQRLHEIYESDMSGNKYVSDDDILDKGPEKGGTLNLFTTKPDTLNPLLTSNSYTADFLGFVYESLTRLDQSQKAVPMLSDRWSVSDDGLIWEFHIRNGILWHDGEPFTAYDAEFTIQTLLNPSIKSPYKSLLANVSQCVAIDSSTIRIALKKPNSFMPEMMTFPVIPKHQFAAVDVLTASKDFKPVGTGPYRFVSYDGGSITLVLNDDWWYPVVDETLASGGMYIEKIQVNVFNRIEDAMGAFQSGEVDVVGLDFNEYLKYMDRTDLTIKSYASRNFEFISLNMDDPVLSDIYARRAIYLSIDRGRIINELLRGAAEEADLPVLPTCWLEDANETEKGINPGKGGKNTLRQPESSPTDIAGGDNTNADADDQYESRSVTDLSTAKTPDAVLTLGGWKKNEQGYYKVIRGSRRYLSLELLVNSNNSMRVKVAEMICRQLEEAGIKTTLVQLPWKDVLNRVNNGRYKMAFLGCRVPQIPDISFMYSDSYLKYASSSGYSEAYNVSGYGSPAADEYISEFFLENDAQARKEVYKALKDRVLADCPYIGLYFLKDAVVFGRNVKGPLNPDTWNRFHDFCRWYKPAP